MPETARAVNYYKALHEVAAAINSSLERDVVLKQIVKGAARAAATKACSLMLLSGDQKTLLHVAACGLSERYMRKGPVSVDISLADALKGKAVAVFAACDDPRVQYREQARREGIASMLCVPVVLKERVIGVMRLYTAEPRHFAEEDTSFLTAVANLGAIALENAKLYETIKANDALRKRLFAIASHDLREPLVTAYSYLKAILDGVAGEPGPQLRDMLERIAKRLRELLDLHSTIMEARGFDPEQVLSQRETVSLRELVEQTVESVHASAEKKSIALKTELTLEPCTVYASANHVRRVLLNLLSNAIKFTPVRGGVLIRLSETKDCFQVDTIDNGNGISPQDLPHVFEEFYRGGSAPEKGLGLGLSIAKRVVEAHGGTIWAESPCAGTEGARGTRMSFVLPKSAGG
ncbi:MAG: GAF domain-containing sensor histidine kinase [Chloroflexi bacterium]|nr:GAF domain-containing sensor histidine kinase [Chloroflexota bacterium]